VKERCSAETSALLRKKVAMAEKTTGAFMKVEIVNPVDCPAWDARVLALENYSFFHTSHWSKVLCNTYKFSPAYFVLSEDGKMLALMPMVEIRSILTGRRGVSLAFSDYCEPIAADRSAFDLLLAQVIHYAKVSGWKYIELRGGQKYLSDAPTSAQFLGHALVLTSNLEELLSRFRSNTRWSIRKATQEGVQVRTGNNLECVEEFYRLHCMTRKRHGIPPQPFHFFRNIHECILDNNLGYVVLAYYKSRNIAGAVFFHFGNKAVYKYSASDFNYRQVCANNLVLWEAIKLYASAGFTELCLGRTDPGNNGLQYYKNGWNTVQKKISYFTYDIKQGRFVGKEKKQHDISTLLMQKCPLTVLKTSGQILYKHMD